MTTPATDPVEYAEGSIKRNPDTKAVAVRTSFPDDENFGSQAWLVATVNLGARHASTADVSSAAWVDVPTA